MKQKSNYIQLMVDCTMYDLTYVEWSEFMAKRGVEITWQAIRDRHARRVKKRYTLRMVVGLDKLKVYKYKEKPVQNMDEISTFLSKRLVGV